MTTATAVDYLEMGIAKVVGLSAADNELRQYVVLEEVTGDRQVAMEIGQAGAFSLAARLASSHDRPVRRYLGASPWRAGAGRGPLQRRLGPLPVAGLDAASLTRCRRRELVAASAADRVSGWPWRLERCL